MKLILFFLLLFPSLSFAKDQFYWVTRCNGDISKAKIYDHPGYTSFEGYSEINSILAKPNSCIQLVVNSRGSKYYGFSPIFYKEDSLIFFFKSNKLTLGDYELKLEISYSEANTSKNIKKTCGDDDDKPRKLITINKTIKLQLKSNSEKYLSYDLKSLFSSWRLKKLIINLTVLNNSNEVLFSKKSYFVNYPFCDKEELFNTLYE